MVDLRNNLCQRVFLSMFSSRNFMVCLTFRSLNHFQFNFLYSDQECSIFTVLYVDWLTWAYGFIHELSILIRWFMCLLLHQHMLFWLLYICSIVWNQGAWFPSSIFLKFRFQLLLFFCRKVYLGPSEASRKSTTVLNLAQKYDVPWGVCEFQTLQKMSPRYPGDMDATQRTTLIQNVAPGRCLNRLGIWE